MRVQQHRSSSLQLWSAFFTEACQCIVVVRWTRQLPLRLPYATRSSLSYHSKPLITTVSPACQGNHSVVKTTNWFLQTTGNTHNKQVCLTQTLSTHRYTHTVCLGIKLSYPAIFLLSMFCNCSQTLTAKMHLMMCIKYWISNTKSVSMIVDRSTDLHPYLVVVIACLLSPFSRIWQDCLCGWFETMRR